MSALTGYVDRRVLLIMHDGRTIVGTLAGSDMKVNVILSDAVERVYSPDEGVEEVPLGLYLVKGEQIVLIGEVDAEKDSKTPLSDVRADPIPHIRY
ncbi:hypothetical protein FRB97_007383 [Tulasnella sp. 331]|nr:hypothetical protein FRB97_007383 [Tulasnella sp. 331]